MSRTRAILAKPQHRRFCREFAHSNVLLAFDYDGTLAPIASTPERARMRPAHRGAAGARLAIDIRAWSSPDACSTTSQDGSKRIPLRYVFGNHGLEPVAPAAHVAQPVDQRVAATPQRRAARPAGRHHRGQDVTP